MAFFFNSPSKSPPRGDLKKPDLILKVKIKNSNLPIAGKRLPSFGGVGGGLNLSL
jgi:hypothetical protein